ncbi:hypothetical protein BGZ60DRAFT_127454 [Tricladium varicosporioides]|nr:hypothetical protein BGZ60DRAFT_127454 [Hymenoscyphus varicosporioides]
MAKYMKPLLVQKPTTSSGSDFQWRGLFPRIQPGEVYKFQHHLERATCQLVLGLVIGKRHISILLGDLQVAITFSRLVVDHILPVWLTQYGYHFQTPNTHRKPILLTPSPMSHSIAFLQPPVPQSLQSQPDLSSQYAATKFWLSLHIWRFC